MGIDSKSGTWQVGRDKWEVELDLTGEVGSWSVDRHWIVSSLERGGGAGGGVFFAAAGIPGTASPRSESRLK